MRAQMAHPEPELRVFLSGRGNGRDGSWTRSPPHSPHPPNGSRSRLRLHTSSRNDPRVAAPFQTPYGSSIRRTVSRVRE